jgi:SNF2 family DNA or RNA helicase
LMIARKKEQVLSLPPKVYTYPELELEDDSLAIYKAMKDLAKLELSLLVKEGVKSIWDPRARSSIEATMRCEQIAQGFVGGIPEVLLSKVSLKHAEKIEGRPNELIFPNSAKLVWIRETIDSILCQFGAPIVYSRFNAPMFWLARKLMSEGRRAGVLHGGLSATDKDDLIQGFQEKRIEVLIAQGTMAEGWNATRCQDVIFLGRSWSPAINSQGEDRAHRMGQKGTVNVQIPIVVNTIERMIDRKLTAKGVDAEQALRDTTLEELLEAL